MQKNVNIEKESKRKSIIITTICSVIILLYLCFSGLQYESPPLGYAIAIDFNQEEPAEIKQPKEEPKPKEVTEFSKKKETAVNSGKNAKLGSGTPNNVASAKGNPEKVYTQEQSHQSMPSAKKPTKVIGSSTGTLQKTNYNSAPKNSGLTINRGTGGKNNSSNKNTGNSSNGILDGDPTSAGAGNNTGSGTSFSTGSRKLLYKPSINFDDCLSNEYGKIVVGIQVDINGSVVLSNVNYNARGTQVHTNACMQAKIKTFLGGVKYSKGSKAIESTTYTFNVNPPH